MDDSVVATTFDSAGVTDPSALVVGALVAGFSAALFFGVPAGFSQPLATFLAGAGALSAGILAYLNGERGRDSTKVQHEVRMDSERERHQIDLDRERERHAADSHRAHVSTLHDRCLPVSTLSLGSLAAKVGGGVCPGIPGTQKDRRRFTGTGGAVIDEPEQRVKAKPFLNVGAACTLSECASSRLASKSMISGCSASIRDREHARRRARLIVRKERPHPGAQLRFTDIDGLRLTAFVTNTRRGQLADLELRHRRRARCEDRTRAAKDTRARNLPFHGYAANQIWLAVVALALDLTAWLQTLALHNHPARRWEPKTLRLQLFSLPARITRHARRMWLRLPRHVPHTHLLTTAIGRLQPG